jgi:hypothetical protein
MPPTSRDTAAVPVTDLAAGIRHVRSQVDVAVVRDVDLVLDAIADPGADRAGRGYVKVLVPIGTQPGARFAPNGTLLTEQVI